jgi:para-aminobenzoate synthetase component I
VLQKTTYTKNEKELNLNINALNRLYDKICYFDSNSKFNCDNHSENDKLIAIGSTQEIIIKDGSNSLEQLQTFIDKNNSWVFGFLNYDLKNEIENLSSENTDNLNFPLLHFFVPKIVIQIIGTDHFIYYDDAITNIDDVKKTYELAFSSSELSNTKGHPVPEIKFRISKEEYLKNFKSIKSHILRGDIYEINFCQEFYAKNAQLDPALIFERLNSISEAPFAAYCRFNDHYLLSSSPERFIKKTGKKLISQPIKGTAKRSENKVEDEKLRAELRNDLKEQNENVMIVDLVRNDLSRIAEKGSVEVDELFGVYSFRQVHQLISTVSCRINESTSFTDILKATFPMGSMTGAPKISAMKLIEEHENTKRGIYSGAIGYISPDGDFDFSVVIRSILYNSSSNYLSFMVGSAITAKAEAENEYNECLLKAKAMFEVLK